MNHKQLHNKEELEVKIYTPRYQALQQQSPTNLFQDHAPVRIYQQPIKSKQFESKPPNGFF